MSHARLALADDDRLRILEVGHAATPGAQPFEAYAGVRLRSPRRREADWWLLEDEGRAVCGLVCYPLRFRDRERTSDGYGIGAVATHPDHRHRGHATALCAHVAQTADDAGRPIGLLFSAIPPALYERLGFRVAPAWHVVCDDPAALAATGTPAALKPLDAHRHAARLAALYEAHHDGLHLLRDEVEVRRSLVRNPEDVFLGVGEPLRGYLRLCLEDPEDVELAEAVVSEEDQAAAIRAAASLTTRLGRSRLVSWLSPTAFPPGHVRDEGRARTLPMVRAHDRLEDARFWSSDYF